jgi:hypothetical protein
LREARTAKISKIKSSETLEELYLRLQELSEDGVFFFEKRTKIFYLFGSAQARESSVG